MFLGDHSLKDLNNEQNRRHAELLDTIADLRPSTVGMVQIVAKLDELRTITDEARFDAFWNDVYRTVTAAFPDARYGIINNWHRYQINDDFAVDIIRQNERARICLRNSAQKLNEGTHPLLSAHVGRMVVRLLNAINTAINDHATLHATAYAEDEPPRHDDVQHLYVESDLTDLALYDDEDVPVSAAHA